MDASENVNLVIGKVRLSFVKLFVEQLKPEDITKDAMGNLKFKYGTSMLIPKENKQLVAKIKEGQDAVLAMYKIKYKGTVPSRMPLRDGDVDRPSDEAYAGCMFINGSIYKKKDQFPTVLKRTSPDVYESATSTEVYSGCYAHVDLALYIYDNAFGKGIACSINKVLFAGNGERLAGGDTLSASSAFGDAEIDEEESYL